MEWKSPYGPPDNLRRKQLIEFCKKNGIKNYSRKRNYEIVQLIEEEEERRQKEASQEVARVAAEAKKKIEDQERKIRTEKRSEKSFYFPNRAWANIISFCNGMLIYKEINTKEDFLENYWRIYQDMMYHDIKDQLKTDKLHIIEKMRQHIMNQRIRIGEIFYSTTSWMNVCHRNGYGSTHYVERNFTNFIIRISNLDIHNIKSFKIKKTSKRFRHKYECKVCKAFFNFWADGESQYIEQQCIGRIPHTASCKYINNIVIAKMAIGYKLNRTYVIPNEYTPKLNIRKAKITDERFYRLFAKLTRELLKQVLDDEEV